MTWANDLFILALETDTIKPCEQNVLLNDHFNCSKLTVRIVDT